MSGAGHLKSSVFFGSTRMCYLGVHSLLASTLGLHTQTFFFTARVWHNFRTDIGGAACIMNDAVNECRCTPAGLRWPKKKWTKNIRIIFLTVPCQAQNMQQKSWHYKIPSSFAAHQFSVWMRWLHFGVVRYGVDKDSATATVMRLNEKAYIIRRIIFFVLWRANNFQKRLFVCCL